ncbi:glycosyltransferase [Intestinibacter sp.]|uniref:glycosyltransferase family 2 protein n=1 Tax=Intestinibacter sp. TaxID=1965304 RepID=UPI00307CE315
MKKLVSIIVPIYNVEQYLDRCIESLVTQSYINLEIILIDDGSKDTSGDICDLWAQRDKRIRLVHKENGGLSDARNKGLDIATGDIISFIDSDDYISKYFYEKLINIMEQTDSDIVECQFKKFNENERVNYLNKENIEFISFNTEEAIKNLILNCELSTTVWNKIYKTSVIKKLKFRVGKTNEDDFYTYLAFDNAKKITKLQDELYYYLQRPESIMGKIYKLNRLDEIEAKYERLKYIEKNYKNLILIAKQDTIFGSLYAYQRLLKDGEESDIEKGKKILSEYINRISFTKRDYSNLNFKNKIWIKLGKISLELTCRIRNFLEIGF